MSEATDIDRRYTGLEIAVIGMAGRFPAAENLDEFWTNLVGGVDAITRFTDDELLAAGVSAMDLTDERYVRAKGVFPRLEYFDAAFFHHTPADATVLDPQVRALHEEVFHALEDAGYSAEGRPESIGLFLGASNNLAWEIHTLSRYIASSDGSFAGMQLNDKDFAATRIAHALGLTGPALTLHTACSTSLVAIDAACRNLWTGACQIAVAGGSGLTLPHKNGYVYQENMILSPDGSCRAFDKDAGGTVEGNGAGAVVLKNLDSALRDGDHIYALIKGSAVNNDGNRKVGYTAPSIEGQAEAIRKAYRVANVSPAEVSYVETHGTGTALGDPVEVEALRKVFGTGTPGTVGIGSLKASIGHLDSAAGVASFIKTCTILDRRTVPKSLHFTDLNPNISLDDSPLYVVAETEELQRKRSAKDQLLPLRAAVSSFGIGGSNAHVVLEEAPAVERATSEGRRWNTFVVAGMSAGAIQRTKQAFADHLSRHPDVDGADLAWTLQNRQRRLPYRYAVEFTDAAQLRERVQESLDAREEPEQLTSTARRDVYFLFSGLGAQHLRMARGLYETEEPFRGHLDACFSISESMGNPVPREVFLGDSVAAEKQLNSIETTQILLFMLEYSMAQTLIGWGLTPQGMIGHSTGELAAACVAGVFSLEDGVRLVHARGSLMNETPEGTLTSVKASADVIGPMLTDELAIAAVNSPEDCTVSGTSTAVAEFERQCAEREIGFTHVEADHAYHSRYMESVLDRFRAVAEQVTFHPPTTPYVSNVTGTWITPEQAVDPDYYCTHVRETVQFRRGVETILERGDVLFVEVGPGKALSSFVRTIGRGTGVTSINMLRHRMEEIGDDEHLARAVKRLWEAGVALDWKAFHQGRTPRKVPLPLYPFDPVEYPVDVTDYLRLLSDPGSDTSAPGSASMAASTTGSTSAATTAILRGSAGADGPSPSLRLTWSMSMLPVSDGKEKPKVLVVLADDVTRVKRVLDEIPQWRALYVSFGAAYEFHGRSGAVIRAGHSGDVKRLVDDLEEHALAGDTFLVQREDPAAVTTLVGDLCALVPEMRDPCVTDVVVMDTGDVVRRRADVLPRLLGLNLEHPDLRVRAIRCEMSSRGGRSRNAWRECLQNELETERSDDIAVRYEGGRRLVPMMVPVHGQHGRPGGRAGRTTIVCRTVDVDDVLVGLAHAWLSRTVQVVPIGTDAAAPVATTGRGRLTVLPAVTAPTWDAVASGLERRLRELPALEEIVVWDAGVGRSAAPMDATGRRALLRGIRAAGREQGVPCRVLSLPHLDRQGWNAEVTGWFADNALLDAELGLTRLYAFAGVVDGDQSVLDLLAQQDESGISTAFHGADLIAAQAAAASVAPVDDAGRVGERLAVVALIAQELARLLGFDEINTRVDMFDLGLDSVKLVQLIGALEKQGYKVLAADVYNHPTADGLAAFIDRSEQHIRPDGDSTASVAALLEERLGTPCRFQEVRPEPTDDPLVLLFVEGLDDDLRAKVVREINGLGVPHELVPHHILPLTREGDFLATRDFASLGIDTGTGTDAMPRDGGVQAVFEEIDRCQEELRRSIGSQPVKWTYPISGMQKHHFGSEARLQLYLIQFRELVDVEILQRALCDVVARHGLMRSFLTRSFGRFRWKEFEAPTTFTLPLMDLSGLEPQRQDEVRAELVKREWTMDFKVVDKPMYEAVLVKYNERSYDLHFQFDHSIFDAASGQTLRGDLLRRYEALSAGTSRAMPVARSFRHLQDQIRKGPVGITPAEIIERFDLATWAREAKAIRAKAARHQGKQIRAARYSVDLDRFAAADGGGAEPFSLAVHLYARVVARLLEVDKVALDLLFQAREYEGRHYSDVMGMVLDSMPVVVSGERDETDDLEAIVSAKFRLMNKHNISFLDLIHDLRSLLRFGKIVAATKDARGESFRSSCLLNFVGNVEGEYDAIWDMTLGQITDDQNTLDYADCYCVAKVTGGRLDLLVLTAWVDEPGDVIAILDDEVGHLMRDGALSAT